jgi:hypothetical protein
MGLVSLVRAPRAPENLNTKFMDHHIKKSTINPG